MNRDVLEPLLAPLIGDPKREVVIPLRAGRVRLGSEIAVELLDLVSRREGAIALLEGVFLFSGARRKT